MISSRPRNRDRSTHLSDILSHAIDVLSSLSDDALEKLSNALDEARLFKETLDAKTIATLERLKRALRSSVFSFVTDVSAIERLEEAVSSCISSSVSSRPSSTYLTMKGGDEVSLECITPEFDLLTVLNNSTIQISEFGIYLFKAKYVTASDERVSLIVNQSNHLPTYEVTRPCINNSVEVETDWFYDYRRATSSQCPDLVITIQSSSPIVFDSSLFHISRLN